MLDLGLELGIDGKDSPCIFAGGNCNNNPLGFAFTVLDDDGSYVSPTYTVGQIRNIVGDTFAVAIGIGFAGHNPTHLLNYFDMKNVTADTILAAYDPVSGTALNVGSDPGASAVSDYVLALFDLSGLDDAIEIVFNLDMTEFNDGPDFFFLVSQVTPVPLPAALPLLGAALGGLGLLGWRRKRRVSRSPSPAT